MTAYPSPWDPGIWRPRRSSTPTPTPTGGVNSMAGGIVSAAGGLKSGDPTAMGCCCTPTPTPTPCYTIGDGPGCNPGTTPKTFLLTVSGTTPCPCTDMGVGETLSVLASGSFNGTWCLTGDGTDGSGNWIWTMTPFTVIIDQMNAGVCGGTFDVTTYPFSGYILKRAVAGGLWALYGGTGPYVAFYGTSATTDPVDCNLVLNFASTITCGNDTSGQGGVTTVAGGSAVLTACGC